MTARSEPPGIDGLSYLRWLGGGGFADVFLYRQHRPDREVAVKALRLQASGGELRRAFDAEADLMARVSDHPYIVSVFSAAVAADGRPCLVMEYYPNGHFGELSRPGGLSVERALRTGIQVASAVETAHRAGILHRDIKPTNVLLSRLRKPGLTDFGIAGLTGDARRSAGMSIPYAAPEVLGDEGSGSVRSDVYSMAATVYALMAGRSPFEVAGRNAEAELVARVLHGEPAPLDCPGVPPSLEYLLRQGLSRRADDRPASALSFARGLQDIERELRLDVTAIEVQDEVSPHQRPLDDTERTRAAPPRAIDTGRLPEHAPEGMAAWAGGAAVLVPDDASRTRLRPVTQPGAEPPHGETVSHVRQAGLNRWVVASAVAAVMLIVGLAATLIFGGLGTASPHKFSSFTTPTSGSRTIPPTTATTVPPTTVPPTTVPPPATTLPPTTVPPITSLPPALATGSPAGPSGRLYPITQTTHLRDAPSTTGNQLAVVPVGTQVGVQCKQVGQTVTAIWGPDPYWDQIIYGGTRGYVTDEWVDTQSDESNNAAIPPC